MIETKLLREKIDKSGYKVRYIAKQIGLSYQGFLNRMAGKNEFNVAEVQVLTELLKIEIGEKEAIFFANTVGRKPTDVE
ncbi:MAG: hypothetical protein LBI42_15635 [Chitinispirillales bacterium]|jgi:hypothetical protein|nr:hypothetical protein [Chitinispirillales bacterium]